MSKTKNRKPKAENQKPKTVLAKKSFGQNFLVDENYIEKIVKALEPKAGETIVEIGAGRGALTQRLLKSGARIVAIELDRDLIPVLKEKFEEYENFSLIESDALKVDFSQILPREKCRLVANLPYYISTAILQHLIEHRAAFTEMILMFQREVVERITAKPSTGERGFLSVMTEAYLNAEKLFDVPPAAFAPAPKVWSAVTRLITKEDSENKIENDGLFRRVVSAGFAQRRKTILNNLKILKSEMNDKTVEHLLDGCGIETGRRAETLSLPEWICLANSMREK